MVERKRTKPGGKDIKVFMGDFADAAVDGTYSLIYAVIGTMHLLLTQDDQQRCLAKAARRLERNGNIVVQANVQDMARLSQRQAVSVGHLDLDHVYLEAMRHDAVHQRVDVQQIVISQEGVRLYPVSYRYIWPSELDLMAQLAGLRLRDRWGDWEGQIFGATSRLHVSVYELATSAAT